MWRKSRLPSDNFRKERKDSPFLYFRARRKKMDPGQEKMYIMSKERVTSGTMESNIPGRFSF